MVTLCVWIAVLWIDDVVAGLVECAALFALIATMVCVGAKECVSALGRDVASEGEVSGIEGGGEGLLEHGGLLEWKE